jgi:hypothetical protein
VKCRNNHGNHQSARNYDPAYQLPFSLLLIFVLVRSPNLLGEISFQLFVMKAHM